MSLQHAATQPRRTSAMKHLKALLASISDNLHVCFQKIVNPHTPVTVQPCGDLGDGARTRAAWAAPYASSSSASTSTTCRTFHICHLSPSLSLHHPLLPSHSTTPYTSIDSSHSQQQITPRLSHRRQSTKRQSTPTLVQRKLCLHNEAFARRYQLLGAFPLDDYLHLWFQDPAVAPFSLFYHLLLVTILPNTRRGSSQVAVALQGLCLLSITVPFHNERPDTHGSKTENDRY
jgi:hypothetical protein